MSECDEIWATSEFVKSVYEKNNVHHNIHVIPHGISPDFEIYERELTGKFNFLHVGGESKRKNAQLVVDAFLELYDGQEDYQLVLKYNKFCDADAYVDGKIVPAHNHPQIIAIPHALDAYEMVKLYHKCHCLVYPTSGEGFGMIPFEAIATGMPSIVTNLTGTADFAKMSIPLEAEWGEAPLQSHLYGCDAGEWAIPSYDALVDLMEHVADEYDMFKIYTLKSARILHSEWSWSATADKIIDRLEKFEESF
jgi:glycosyltransferase involved in cell wall biosynthesis